LEEIVTLVRRKQAAHGSDSFSKVAIGTCRGLSDGAPQPAASVVPGIATGMSGLTWGDHVGERVLMGNTASKILMVGG
jgi:hypothetical protein